MKSLINRLLTKPGYKYLFFIVLLIFSAQTYSHFQEQRVISKDCVSCHDKHSKMVDYFKKSKNKHPYQMADAVLATNKPSLLAAVAVAGEKNTPYTVRKGGYKGRHQGAWQVNPKYWGPVSHDPVDQAKQAEKILNELTGTMPVEKALNYYGGDSKGKYANRVLAELQEVP